MSYKFSIFIAALALAFVWVGTFLNKGGNRLLAMDVEDGEKYYELCNDSYEAVAPISIAAALTSYAAEASAKPTDLNNHPNTNEREEVHVGITKHHPAGFNNPNEGVNETDEQNMDTLATAAQADLTSAANAETFVEGLGGPLYEERMHTKDGDALSMPKVAGEQETGNGTQGEW